VSKRHVTLTTELGSVRMGAALGSEEEKFKIPTPH